ncbi:polyadenylate-binding protein 2-like [Amaranthus tricolor]|uniref:polyadenylate-binding protein 2-like n=1 Tax=Amaranthus tricolor TaxID=29722 RepID=UPI0025866DA7|nr:polyadenylate-binding protein 2-like [Amaranthus tricolor]
MDEEEHEVYRGDIPVNGDMEGDMDPHNPDVNISSADADVYKELDEMKKRIKEIEEIAAALREICDKVEKKMDADQDPASVAELVNKEVDSRSVYVSNVDYACTTEDVQQHFQACGTINRVTILTDEFGLPKGVAYVEFEEQDAAQQALKLNESELHARQLKVLPKRTNVPGKKQYRGWYFNPYMDFYPGPYFYDPYSYGKAHRSRRPTRYEPYS